jgi:polar amino acid transport system substrate-binding protein
MIAWSDRGSRWRGLLATAVALIVVAALALALAGCGDDDEGEEGATGATAATFDPSTVTEDPAVAAQVPADVKEEGTLTVATDASYPPDEFIAEDGKTIIGMDPDMAQALGNTMGLEVKLINATFDSILPGIAAEKYDLGMSSFTDTKEREQTVDMVTYMVAGTGFYTQADGGTEISGLADLCGLTIAVERGTTQADDGEAQSQKCVKADDEPVKVDTFNDQNGANLAVTSKRAEIGMADSPVAAYIVKQSDGKLKSTGKDYGEAPYGIALDKGSELTPVVLAAVKSLIANGHYEAILAAWGLENQAIDEPKVNDGIE